VATVLVVDDSAESRLLVRVLLESEGHAVAEAVDGVAALTEVRASQPDLVVADLSLPELSGAELIRRLRADPSTRSVKVALYTATEVNAAIRDFMDTYGVECVISKPAEPQALLQTVRDALGSCPT